ncbi:hypothetical protein QBC43DRAFT_361487 [Cladorrhinum sp. PSN259]|nr:hypothetical protein QBC43DRAFT_361487 [Cladorrhinum sp. PSN259]
MTAERPSHGPDAGADGEYWPLHLWNHLSIVLHPLRNRESDERRDLPADKKIGSTNFLRNRSQGFLFLSWFNKPTGRIPWEQRRELDVPPGSVGLFGTVDFPHELVAIKRILGITKHTMRFMRQGTKYPPELAYSTVLGDLRAEDVIQLPSWPPVFAHTYALQVHRMVPLQDFEATIFMKYYNGGTLKEFLQKFRDNKEHVPEPFIWHVIAELGRAFAFLHTGTMRGYDDTGRDRDSYIRSRDSDRYDDPILSCPTVPEWDPIIHSDAHLDNIWLQYPTREEVIYIRNEYPEQRYGDEFPMVVLGDFGVAFNESRALQLYDEARREQTERKYARERARREQERRQQTRRKQARRAEPRWWEPEGEDDYCCFNQPTMPERSTWRDKASLGFIIKHLMLATHPHVNTDTNNMHNDFMRPDGTQVSLAPAGWEAAVVTTYSQSLQDVAAAFESLVSLLTHGVRGQRDFFTSLAHATSADWTRWPTNQWLYGQRIAEADYVVRTTLWNQEFHHDRWEVPGLDNGARSLRWTKPIESVVPIRSRDRYPPTIRTDWRVVWKDLEKVIETEFNDHEYPDHAPYERRPVEIMKVWPDFVRQEDREMVTVDSEFQRFDPIDPAEDDWDYVKDKKASKRASEEKRRWTEWRLRSTAPSDPDEDPDEEMPDYESSQSPEEQRWGAQARRAQIAASGLGSQYRYVGGHSSNKKQKKVRRREKKVHFR